jgi:hypothetical protein
LGAAADNVDDPQVASSITSELSERLLGAQDEQEMVLYLDALGNTGHPDALTIIADHITGIAEIRAAADITDSFNIEVAALNALRKIPGDAAEGLLLNVLNTSNDEVKDDPELFVKREMAFAIVSLRSDPDNPATLQLKQDALENYKTGQLAVPSGYYTRSWNRHFGGSTVGVNTPGFLGIATPPSYLPYLYARQEAVAHIWSYNLRLIYGDLLAKSTGSVFQFRAYLSLGNNLIQREYNVNLPCSYNNGGNLYNTTITLFNVTVSVPVFWALTINVNIRGSGYFSLDWTYNHNVCAVTTGNFTGRITPHVYAAGEASAYLDIVVARGGVTLQADLLRTNVPAQASVNYNTAIANGTSFCINITANTQGLNGRLFAWGDLRAPRWGIPPWYWKRIVEGNLWTFSTPAATYVLLNQCL